jgi:protein SCO1/2
MEKRSYNSKLAMLSIAAVLSAAIAGFGIYKAFLQQGNLPVIKAAPQFTMNDIHGNPVSFEDVGKVKLIYFFFASCTDVCPVANQTLKKVQDELKSENVFGSEVQLFSITVDPKRDTHEVLKEYAQQFGADESGWKFLRSETPQEVRAVAERFGAGVLNEGGQMAHADIIFLVDEHNQLRQYYMDKDADSIVADVMRLL